MLEVQVTKERARGTGPVGDSYSMSVSINKTLGVRREVTDLVEIPEEYIIEQMVSDIANSFREEIKLQVSRAMSRPVKQVRSN